jgi:hypothetical protein
MKWVWIAISIQLISIIWEGVAYGPDVETLGYISPTQWLSLVGMAAAAAAGWGLLRRNGSVAPWLAGAVFGSALAELAGWLWDNLVFHSSGSVSAIQIIPHLLMNLGFLALLLFTIASSVSLLRRRKHAARSM